MSDPDDDALTWEGDDRLQTPRRPAPSLVSRDTDAGPGAAGLVVLGVLGGVALVETLLWIRGVFELSIAASVTTGRGTSLEVVAFAVNVAFRALAVAAPVVWFLAVLRVVRQPSRRLAWLLLGAVVLVPWPFVLGAL